MPTVGLIRRGRPVTAPRCTVLGSIVISPQSSGADLLPCAMGHGPWAMLWTGGVQLEVDHLVLGLARRCSAHPHHPSRSSSIAASPAQASKELDGRRSVCWMQLHTNVTAGRSGCEQCQAWLRAQAFWAVAKPFVSLSSVFRRSFVSPDYHNNRGNNLGNNLGCQLAVPLVRLGTTGCAA